jgi:hypothetical protein
MEFLSASLLGACSPAIIIIFLIQGLEAIPDLTPTRQRKSPLVLSAFSVILILEYLGSEQRSDWGRTHALHC